MSENDSDEIIISESGIEVRKSRDPEQYQHLVVTFELRSSRDQPVEIRLTDHVPESVPVDSVGFYRDHGADAWRKDGRRVVYERTLAPGEDHATLYGVTDGYEELASGPLAEPELAVPDPPGEEDETTTSSWGFGRFVPRLPGRWALLSRLLFLVVAVYVLGIAGGLVLTPYPSLAMTLGSLLLLGAVLVGAWKWLWRGEFSLIRAILSDESLWSRLKEAWGPTVVRGVAKDISHKPLQDTENTFRLPTLSFYVEVPGDAGDPEEYVFVRIRGKDIPGFLGEGHEVEVAGSFDGDVLKPRKITNLTTDTSIRKNQWK